MIRFRRKYAPGKCEHGGYHEIRWDVLGCNLRCQFCWSPASRPEKTDEPLCEKDPETVVQDTQDAIIDAKKTFIRFTGGEPTLQWEEISAALRMFNDHPILKQIPILIQTNGIEIGKERVDLGIFEEQDAQRYLVELSFKGTNPGEFRLLTGKDPGLYQYQLRAYHMLSQIADLSCNVCVVAVLGIYHSALDGPSKYAFKGRDGKLLFDNPALWDPGFRMIWESTDKKWVESLRMFPKGMWDKLLERCGPKGSRILHYSEGGFNSDAKGIFMAKPDSAILATSIVHGMYWPET